MGAISDELGTGNTCHFRKSIVKWFTLVLPTGFGKSMCYVPLFGQGTTSFFFLMVICNSLLLFKSLPINIINCIKFYVNCSALTGMYDWQYKYFTARFCLRSYDSAICLPFFKHLSRDYEKTTITAMYHGRWFAYKQTNKYLYCQSFFWTRYYIIFFFLWLSVIHYCC
jgi:hypothetical protein